MTARPQQERHTAHFSCHSSTRLWQWKHPMFRLIPIQIQDCIVPHAAGLDTAGRNGNNKKREAYLNASLATASSCSVARCGHLLHRQARHLIVDDLRLGLLDSPSFTTLVMG